MRTSKSSKKKADTKITPAPEGLDFKCPYSPGTIPYYAWWEGVAAVVVTLFSDYSGFLDKFSYITSQANIVRKGKGK